MSAGSGARGLQSPGAVARRLRNQARRAAQDIAALEEARALSEHSYAAYELAPHTELDVDDLLGWVLRARAERPGQHLAIAISAREPTQPTQPNGAK